MNPTDSADAETPRVRGRRTRLRRDVLESYPARPVVGSWPATEVGRAEARARLCRPPFAVSGSVGTYRTVGVDLLLDWLSEQPGRSWQARWTAAEPDLHGTAWTRARVAWLAGRERSLSWHSDQMGAAVRTAISAD